MPPLSENSTARHWPETLRRGLWALALGLFGLGLNTLVVSLLTPETPQFVLGGGAVLLAFVWLGPAAGLLAACVSLVGIWSGLAVENLVTGIYVLEAVATYALYRRTGSLVFGVSAFWLGIGWLLDLVLYGAWLGLTRDYLALLFLKQLLNGLLNAIVVDAILVLPWIGPRLRDEKLPARLHDYVFARVALAVMAPSLVLSMFYTRASYERRIELAMARERGTTLDVAAAVAAALPVSDAGRFVELLRAGRSHAGQTLTLFDTREGSVVATLDPTLRPGQSLRGRFPAEVTSTRQGSFTYYPPPDSSRTARLGLDLRHGAFAAVPGSELRVEAEIKAATLHAEMAPSALQLALFFAVTLLFLYVAIARFSRQVSRPLAALNRTAEAIAAGRLAAAAEVVSLVESPLREVRSLASHVLRMAQALQANDKAVQESLRRKETMYAMGSLVAGVAHEVRNPLFGISATLDAAEARLGERPEFSAYVKVLRHEVARLSELMEDLLEYGRPPASAMETGPLREILDDAVAECLSLASAADISIDIGADPELPRLRLDRRRMTQVFVNLVENAVQHAPRGSRVDINARLAEAAGASLVVASVRDRGPGFSAEEKAAAFAPFFSRRAGGTGLGLSIVQRIVEEHGGIVAAGNHPEGGGLLTVTLPAAAVEP